jgi:hypothetical protein
MRRQLGLLVLAIVVTGCTGGTPDSSKAAPRVTTTTAAAPGSTSTTSTTSTTLPPPPPPGHVVFADCVPGFHNPPGRTDICIPD